MMKDGSADEDPRERGGSEKDEDKIQSGVQINEEGESTGSTEQNDLVDSIPSDEIEEMADGLEVVFRQREAMTAVLSELDSRRLSGEPAQDAATAFVRDFPRDRELVAFGRLAKQLDHDDLERLLDRCVAEGCLNNHMKEELLVFWTQFSWLEEVIEELLQAPEENRWTNIQRGYRYTQNEVIITENGYRGIDEMWEAEAKPVSYLLRSIQTLIDIHRVYEDLPSNAITDEDDLERMSGIIDDMRDFLDDIEESIDHRLKIEDLDRDEIDTEDLIE